MKHFTMLTLALLLLSGCASERVANLLEPDKPGLQATAQISNVPFHAQQAYLCGPSAMAMALEHAGAQVNTAQLAPDLFIPERKGSLQIEMMALPRRYGIVAYQIEPNLTALLSEVAAGHPVIVLQNLSLPLAPQWHYAVVTGYNLNDQTILLHSGKQANYRMDLSTFDRTWQRSDNWAMLALPPSELPATASANQYLQSVTMLERTGHSQAALVSYRAAHSRWPENPVAGIGIGNILYAAGKPEAAADAFRQVIARHPNTAAAYNNLAQVYLDQGKLDQALAAVQRSIQIDASSSLYHQTWQEIVARQHANAAASTTL